ncbi:MAG: hypothetical protein WCW62_08190 [Bacteroidales bacterium]
MVKKTLVRESLLVILLAATFLYGCKKDSSIEVSGVITDPNQTIPVENARVELWTQQIDSGIFSANYVLQGTATTGPDGLFHFIIDKKNYTGIRLIFSKDKYYGWQAELNVNSENNYHAEYQLLPQAQLQIRVKNNEPFNTADYFEFRILNGYTGCEECCHGEKYQFTGMEVDQTINCRTAGHQDILIQWSSRKSGEQVYKTETYFIMEFETTVIEFLY